MEVTKGNVEPRIFICDISGQTLTDVGFPKIENEDQPVLGCTFSLNSAYGGLGDSDFSEKRSEFHFNEEITKDIIRFVKDEYGIDLINYSNEE